MRYHQIARDKRRDDPVTLPVIAHNASTSTPASPTDDDDADVLSEVFGVALRDSSSDDQGSATSQAIRACEHPTLARMLASFKDVMLGTDFQIDPVTLMPDAFQPYYIVCI